MTAPAIQHHNTDLPAPEWTPTDVQPSTRDLPIWPTAADLSEIQR